MARITWGDPGSRQFEAGLDRGVLYPPLLPGVVWNGLTEIQEKPLGGDPKPFYIDGFKYVNLARAEEFAATLTALSSPSAFGVCDGTVEVSNGLFATQQPRKPFGLCYRTRVGNDVDGTDHSYKLHLIYNALAEPASRNRQTLGDSPEPMELSWDISTQAPKMSGRRPTAHLIVDSTRTPAGLLVTIENILYGEEGIDPRQPSAQELIDLFTNWSEI